jgi:hypothetical protein
MQAGKETAKKIEDKTEGKAMHALVPLASIGTLSLEDQKKLALANVVTDFQDIEQELLTARILLGMKPIYGGEFVMEVLRSRGLVTDDVAKLFKIVRQSRNFAAHGMVDAITPEAAGAYYQQASIVLESVREAIAKLRAKA